jgi:polyphosphate kinase 2 (PPK2 family)
VLVIFQAMDAAGKDGAIKHVMSGVNPQGCEVFAFKQPSVEELNHGFLWRTSKRVSERGKIGIFNRSYYEEVLVARVHKEVLESERIPPSLMSKDIWKERFADINAHERYLTRNGIVIRKFFLNLSKKEQRKRFLARLEEQMIHNNATPEAAWYVVPADNKWYTCLVVASAIVHALEDLNLSYPKVDAAKRKELKAARIALEHEGDH